MDQEYQEKSSFDLKDLLLFLRENWHWVLVSFIVCLGLAITYIKIKQPVYLRTAQLLIKDEDTMSSMGGAMGEMAALDMFGKTSNVYNEINVISSPDLMLRVVEKLDLNNSYTLKDFLKKKSLYADSIPVKVNVPADLEHMSFGFVLDIDANGSYTMKKIYLLKNKDFDKVKGVLGRPVKTPLGVMTIDRTPAFAEMEKPMTIIYGHQDAYQKALSLVETMTAEKTDNKSSIIDLGYKDVNIKRADDLLTELINEYNTDWINDKNQVIENSSAFIQDRLGSLEKELGTVDTDISSFKSSNLLPDLASTSQITLQEASQASAKILELNNQLYMAKYVKQHLADMTSSQTIPANSGFESQGLAQQINLYNTKVMERNNLASVSGSSNPALQDFDAMLADMRRSIDVAITGQIANLQEQIRAQERHEDQVVSKIASNPNQARYLLSVERQQKVKESLYLYMLQKLEENNLSKTYTAFNNRVIRKPNGAPLPVAPRSKIILILAVLAGFGLPIGWYFLMRLLRTTVHDRKELEEYQIPILGEISLTDDARRGHCRRLLAKLCPRRRLADEKCRVVVGKGQGGMLNEEFRMLRTNLTMMMSREGSNNVATVTSFNPGSGKSFISVNLGIALALKGKRVALVDCDLRHGSTSRFVGSPRTGLTDCLLGVADLQSVAVAFPDVDNLTVIPIGKVPPNPTELLESDRFGAVVASLSQQYDYVLLDCPPLNIVADTDIVKQHADNTVFVVRMGLFRRENLDELNQIYQEKKLPHMALVLNGVKMSRVMAQYGAASGNYYN